jgi:2-oxoglutarate ferredoxin oxidoreductase subunit alpha
MLGEGGSVSTATEHPRHPTVELDRVVIRFAGDSGDGMQLTGTQFTTASSLFGNDTATLPDFPAEIRAPAGTLAGVSAFQVHISDHDILTPGDAPSVLVAMNPAALKANLSAVAPGGTLIVNVDAFEDRALEKAGYPSNPLTDGTLASYTVYEVPMTSLTMQVGKEAGVKPRDAERSKNFFALGLVSWLYSRPTESIVEWIANRFKSDPLVLDANTRAFRAGYNFGETTELFESNYQVRPAQLEPGTYTNITGNTALAWGLIAAARQAGLSIFLGSYPITPASDILHELSKEKHFGVRTLQAEDEIAGIGSAIGAAFGGSLGVTTTSGPGIDLKSESIGLAVSLELPLVVVDIQRGGPSTGLPTKTEQSDLLHAMYGRHGEAPVPIVAARTPSHCFAAAVEAVRIAVTYRTPVILLSDGYLANGSEPWRLPDVSSLPSIDPAFAEATGPVLNEPEPNENKEKGNGHVEGHPNGSGVAGGGEAGFQPYARDPSTLARPWAIPGTPGLEHRIGGLEKEDVTGDVSYDPANHEHMVHLRAAKVSGIAASLPPLEVDDVDGPGAAPVLVLGWGSTYGAIAAGVRRVRARGLQVAHAHLVHLNPFPPNLGEVVRAYPKVLVPETNLGQLVKLVRAAFLVDAHSLTKVQGLPFRAAEVEEAVLKLLGVNPETSLAEEDVAS